MGEVFLVRHGQASFGSDDYDRLSALGRQQARWLGEHLAATGARFDRVVHGSLRRQRDTATEILAHVPAEDRVEDPRLNELDYDALEAAFIAATGATRPASGAEFRTMLPELLAHWRNDRLAPVPEPFAAFEARVWQAVAEAMKPGARVLMVSSGGPVSVTLARLLGLGPQAMAEVMNLTMNASITRLALIDGRASLLQFNATPHLDHPDRAHARTFI